MDGLRVTQSPRSLRALGGAPDICLLSDLTIATAPDILAPWSTSASSVVDDGAAVAKVNRDSVRAAGAGPSHRRKSCGWPG